MRVLHVLTTPNRRGAETGAVALDAALRARGVQGDIVALTSGGGGPRLDVPALGGGSLSPLTLSRLRTRSRSADVVVAHGSRTLPASAMSLLGTRTPFVYKNIGDTAFWSASPFRRLRVGAALRRASAVVAMTADAERALHEHHRLGAHVVRVIPSWRSGERFGPVTPERRDRARRAYGIGSDDLVYLVMGALSPEKCVGLAIEALAQVPGTRLVVVGDGPDRARLEAQARDLMPGRHLFTGIVSEPESVLPVADVVMLTSESEGVPGVLIEAGLSCLPVVAFDVGGVSAVVEHGRTGVLVPPGDVGGLIAAATQVLPHAEVMGRRAREKCLLEFDMDTVVDRWLHLLTTVAASQGGMRQRARR